MSDPPRMLRSTIVLAVAGMVLVSLLAGLATVVEGSQRDARQALADRFATRASLTAAFARSYVEDIARQERSQAERLLAGDVDQATFEQVVTAFDFDAAVLLDDAGLLLQVWPARPGLLGKDMTVDYPHLRAAVEGSTGVSQMVPSAAEGISITAVAVPYETPSGRRVLSGAFAPATSPLGSYLASANPVARSNALLVDRAGAILAAGHHDANLERSVKDLEVGVHSVRVGDTKLTVAVAEVRDTPWRVVLAAPSAALFRPAAHGRWAPWTLLAALAIVGAMAMVLFVRLTRARLLATASARTDLLTGLANRRAMEEHLARLSANTARHGRDLVALMIDVDHFKRINDELGHEGGDIALRRIAERVQSSLRAGDIAGRWGGEEFVVLLPDTDQTGGVVVAERIRHAIAFGDSRSPGTPMTVSIGVAAFHTDADALVRSADCALYQAKAAGRDCVFAAPSPAWDIDQDHSLAML